MLGITKRPKLLVLARHGESIINALKEGHTFCPTREAADILSKTPSHLAPLTDRGQLQAANLGVKLSKEFGTFDVIIHSGYVRTKVTAEIASRFLRGEAPPIFSDFRLRERESGYGYAMMEEEYNHHFPHAKEYWKSTGWFYATPPGGESCAQTWQRGIPAIEQIFKRYSGKRVCIVGHGRFFQILQTYLGGEPFTDPKCLLRHLDNCEYATYHF